MRTSVLLLIIAFSSPIFAQTDSTIVLRSLEVQGYRYDRPALEVPVSIGTIDGSDLSRFNDQSIVAAVNTIPGVRMEERSPGSYRFSIRGSLIRSPFGVRNVKVYWHGLPLTDGGGNTYLNLIDMASVGSMEVIKGPGASLYGAGTGGVVLFDPPTAKQKSVEVGVSRGSYNLRRYTLKGEFAAGKTNASVQLIRQASAGYRKQSELEKSAFNTNLSYAISGRSTISTSLFYTDLFYETPGGLTQAQMMEDPKMARPSGATRGAEEQRASVTNKTFFGGVSFHQEWSDKFFSDAGIYVSNTDFKNFAIRNYEDRDETNLGARLENQYKIGGENITTKITFGSEFQNFRSPIKISSNNAGSIGTLNISDDLKSDLLIVFLQSELQLPRDFFVTLGASQSFLDYDFVRQLPDVSELHKKFNSVFSPRIAILKKFTPHVSIYSSVSRGFSPPSLAEVRPSTNNFNPDLAAENGTNYEVGLKSEKEKLAFEVSAYIFRLKNTIVIQRTADNADYFINAGETNQRGLEAALSYHPLKELKLWTSYNYNHYRFEKYVNDNVNYSGNRLTGVPPTLLSAGADFTLPNFYANVTGFYTDAIPLNDLNDEYASKYVLLTVRAGFKKRFTENLEVELFTSVDNILDEEYSLGNDLNAAGKRYYNPAPGRNFTVGVKLKGIAKE
jgi:iron complex outermembrane recepter protein